MKLSDNNNAENETSPKHQIREKWGEAVGKGGLTGFLALPETLIRGQDRLGLSSTEMMVLINILMHWWYADKNPFPSNHNIAKRMGINTRTVQRAIATLEEKGLVQRLVQRFHDKENNVHSARRDIDLDGLVSRLNEIAVDLRQFSAPAQMARDERAAQQQL